MDEVRCGEVLENQQRDTNLKVPLLGFMTKQEHSSIYSHTPKTRRQEEEKAFRSALGASTPHRFTFIIGSNDKCQYIDDYQDTDEDRFCIHLNTIASLRKS